MSQNIVQLRRMVFRRWDATSSTWSTVKLEPEDLGQDTVLTVNVAPRMLERATQKGTTNKPIPGTFDTLSASITFLADKWELIGKVLDRWNAATFTGATSADGNMIFGADNECGNDQPVSVVAQGICDDGSAADVELTRCFPSIDGDLELGSSSTTEVTLALNPQIYNPTTDASDGYPAYSVRFGDVDLATKKRLNVTTGVYDAVTTES